MLCVCGVCEIKNKCTVESCPVLSLAGGLSARTTNYARECPAVRLPCASLPQRAARNLRAALVSNTVEPLPLPNFVYIVLAFMPTAAHVLRRPVLRSLLHPSEVNRALLIPQAPNIPPFSLNDCIIPNEPGSVNGGKEPVGEGGPGSPSPPPYKIPHAPFLPRRIASEPPCSPSALSAMSGRWIYRLWAETPWRCLLVALVRSGEIGGSCMGFAGGVLVYSRTQKGGPCLH